MRNGSRPGGVRRDLARVAGGYAVFIVTEYSVWIAMLVYAYGRGGASLAGWIAVAQLAPAALVAPLAAAVADRRSPVRLLAGGYLGQAAGMAATAAAIAGDHPTAAYAGAILASVAVTTTRPAQATLLPSLATSPDQLTAANVLLGWIETGCITASGLLVGAGIPLFGVSGVFATSAVLAVAASALVAGLHVPRGTARPIAPSRLRAGLADLAAGLSQAIREPGLRLPVALLTAEAVVVGALDLLFVVLAIAVLHRSPAWTGYLNLAYGSGGVLAAAVTVTLVGRRLAVPVVGSTLLLGAALGVLALRPGAAGTVALLVLVGGCRAVLDVATRTLLQRTAPAQRLGRVFGLVEGLTMAGLAAGALAVPALVRLGGSTLALAVVAAVLPVAVLAGGRAAARMDAAARVPVVEIALLRSLPLFAELPPPVIEGLAQALDPVSLPAGAVLMRQGEPGDCYYAIASGELEARQDGGFLRRCGRGEAVGEIALLRDTPRTATVLAASDATLYRLDREPFLAAVTGHAPTHRRAGSIAATRLATRPRRAPSR